MEQLKHLLSTFPTILLRFRLLKVCQKGLGTLTRQHVKTHVIKHKSQNTLSLGISFSQQLDLNIHYISQLALSSTKRHATYHFMKTHHIKMHNITLNKRKAKISSF